MLENIWKRDDVKSLLSEVTLQVKFNHKDIPNTFCEEKITKKQYSLYTCMDAIIKYFIIVDDNRFDRYLEQLRRIMKKLQTHNDIAIAITRLLIQSVKDKLGIKDDSPQSKKVVVQYFYNRYIEEGYVFHSFPGYFYKEEQTLQIENYYYQFEEMKQIQEIIKKYKIGKGFSKNFDTSIGHISFTDSPFMALFYSYNCPLFLYELCIKLIKNDETEEPILDNFFMKSYKNCYYQLDSFLKRKEIPWNDKNRILDFLQMEWNKLEVTKMAPVVACIKRKKLEKSTLEQYQALINSKDSLENIVNRILDVRLNDHQLQNSIQPEFYLKLPNIYEILEQEISQEQNSKETMELNNSYGNATIVALFGVLLIALGITLTIIMMGR